MVQNPKAAPFDGLVRIPLPAGNFEAQIFNAESRSFQPLVHDVLETKHKDNAGTVTSEYTLYTKIKIASGKPALIKLAKTTTSASLAQLNEQEAADLGPSSKSTIEVKGITEKQ